MKFAEGGQAHAGVIVADRASEVERFAAAELVKYVQQMSGVTLPTAGPLPESTGTVPVDYGKDGLTPVYVGRRDRLGLDGLPDPKPGHDGYVIDVTDERVVIAGENDRGTLYGVYDLLERLGCRWYYPTIDAEDPELIPLLDVVELAPLTVAESGGFEWRVAHMGSVLVYLNTEHALHQVDWAAKARYNIVAFLVVGEGMSGLPAQAMEGLDTDELAPAPNTTLEGYIDLINEFETSGIVAKMRERGMLLEGPLHCMIQLFPNSLYDEHPEWFGMTEEGERVPQRPLGPEFCWSNRDAVEQFAANVVEFVRACPFIDIFAFTPNDGGRPCACPTCKLDKPSNLYANVANTVKRALEDAGVGRPVEITGGYPPTPEPPDAGLLDPEIRYHWAHWGRAHFDCYGGADYGMRENLDSFLALPNPFTMVEYYPDGFATPSIHPPVATAIGNDNRWLLEQGVRGNFQLMHPQRQWWNHTLSAWLGITFYYSDRDPAEFLDDYAARYFGAAAAPAMVEYHRILDTEPWLAYWAQGERWSDPLWADEDEAARGSALLDRLEELLDDAEKATTDPLDAYRLGKLLTLGRAQITLGRARARNTPLIHEAARVLKSETTPSEDLVDAVRAAHAFELDVVAPLAKSLWEDPRWLGSDNLYDKWVRTAPATAETITALSARLDAQ